MSAWLHELARLAVVAQLAIKDEAGPAGTGPATADARIVRHAVNRRKKSADVLPAA
jgi:hypothetical protein